MTKLTIEEFTRLSEDQQTIRYKELSEHDRFLARVSAPIFIKQNEDIRSKTLKELVKIERKKFDNDEIDMIDMELLRKKAKVIDEGTK